MTDESPDRPVLSLADQALLRSMSSPSDAQVDETRRKIALRLAALAAGAGAAQVASSAHATAASTSAGVGAAGTTASIAATQGIAALSAAKWISAGLLVTAVAGGTVIATRRAEPAPHVATSAATVSAKAPAATAAEAPADEIAPASPRTMAPAAVETAPNATAQGSRAVASRAAPKLEAPRANARRAAVEPARTTTDLAGELALLRDARQALERGDAAGALQELDAHGARYPNAVLRQEALAARALALCATGRQAEARRAAAQLTRIAPRSPHLIRLADSCAIDPDGE